MDLVLLDTDALNEVLKQKNANVVRHAAGYLKQFGQFTISSMTRYELLRGLKEKQAAAQLSRFEVFCQHTLIIPISNDILDRATDLWVVARQSGYPCRDADLIIAATALETQRGLVTGNTKDFQWIPDLTVSDWRSQ